MLGHAHLETIATYLHRTTAQLRQVPSPLDLLGTPPHVHCLVSGGGLSRDSTRWIAARPGFLFPVHVLGKLFRGKFLAALTTLLATGQLEDDADDRAARRRRQRLYDHSWVVYAKRPFGGPQQVFRYLGHYTHRIAISNHRLVRPNRVHVPRSCSNGLASTWRAVRPVTSARWCAVHCPRVPRSTTAAAERR